MGSTGVDRMKVFSIYTDSTRHLLKKWFLPSLKDDWDLRLIYFPDYKDNGDYRSPQWYKLLQEKLFLLIDAIKKNPGEVILWTDVDFQFFRKCDPEIRTFIAGKDIVFQDWSHFGKTVCMGFMAIRCNPAALSFFEKILATDFSSLEYGDQDVADQILKESKDLRWGVFSKRIYAVYMGEPSSDIIAHHACATDKPFYRGKKYYSSMDLKIKQLRHVRDMVTRPVLFRIKRRVTWLWRGFMGNFSRKGEK